MVGYRSTIISGYRDPRTGPRHVPVKGWLENMSDISYFLTLIYQKVQPVEKSQVFQGVCEGFS